MSEAAWLRRTDIPAPRTEKKLLEFFGIPPDGYDQLEANIARKRRRWHSMKSGVSPQGRQRAEGALRDAVAEPRSAERLATWDSRIGPLLALERPAKALDAARDAQAALGGLPSQLRVHRAEALVLTGRPDDGMVEAIQLRRLHRVRVAAPPQPRPLPARLADLRQG